MLKITKFISHNYSTSKLIYKRGGFSLFVLCLIQKVFNLKVKDETKNIYINRRKHKIILKYLLNKYNYFINSFNPNICPQLPEKNFIWSMWWQDEYPELITACLNSIKTNIKGEVEFIVINRNNYYKYIDLPDYIIQKHNEGIISTTHLSDIIRCKLLRKYGGLWLDATTFIKSPLKWKELTNNNLLRYWTIRLKEKEFNCISNYRWNGADMFMYKNYILSRFIDEFMMVYHNKENNLIDYFLIDYITYICYKKFKTYRRDLRKIPLANENFYTLNKFLNEIYSKDSYKSINGDMFKLNRHWDLKKEKDHQLTNYGFIIKSFS